MTTDLQYPIGRFTPVTPITDAMRRTATDDIAALPARMRKAVAGLTDAQLDTPYRPGGWTVRQVVHHVPDSHLNAYIRLKLALTENAPTIKPYDEKEWAKLADARMPIEVSLALLESVHARWAVLCGDLKLSDWSRTFIHPEYPEGPRTIDWLVQIYAWHSNHHLAHITSLREREGWLA
jgi:DinB family protein